MNDKCGHDKGDIYLKNACELICRVFDHSPVFRIGGDEFAVFLRNHDLEFRDELIDTFEERQNDISRTAGDIWEEIHVALGIAVFDPEQDVSVSDCSRRADKIMYEDKRRKKGINAANDIIK